MTSHFIKSRFFLPQTPWIKERCVLCDLYVAEFGTFHTWSDTIPEGSGLASLLFIKTSAYLFSHEPLKNASLWESSMSKDHLKGSNLKGAYSIFKCIYLNTRRKLWVDTPHTIDVVTSGGWERTREEFVSNKSLCCCLLQQIRKML